MENVQQKQGLTLTEKAAVAVGVSMASGLTFAAGDVPDVSAAVSQLGGLVVPIAALGGATLALKVVLRGWKWVQRAF